MAARCSELVHMITTAKKQSGLAHPLRLIGAHPHTTKIEENTAETHPLVVISRVRVLADEVCVHAAAAKVHQNQAAECHTSICRYFKTEGLQHVELLLLADAVALQSEQCGPGAKVKTALGA